MRQLYLHSVKDNNRIFNFSSLKFYDVIRLHYVMKSKMAARRKLPKAKIGDNQIK